jgi:hypothetical protein
MLSERGLDLTQFDAEAADFDLMVNATEKVYVAIRQIAC